MNIDDVPVGQHTALAVSELPPDESKPAAALEEKESPLPNRLLSKNSRQRLAAFTELLKLFADCPVDTLLDYLVSFPKYISDTHPGAQEKAVEALLLLLSRAPAGRVHVTSDLVAAVIEKACSSGKSSARAKATDCLVAVSKLHGAPTVVLEAALACLNSKTSKTVVAGLQTLTSMLNTFGTAVFPVNATIVGAVVGQAGSSNPGVRAEAMNYLKEAYRWTREGLFPALSSLKQTQQDELKGFASALNEPAAEPKVLLQGSGARPQPMTDVVFAPPPVKREEPEEQKAEGEANLAKFNDGWCANILGMKKWSERRDCLQDLISAAGRPQLKREICADLPSTLKRLLSDSNVTVVNLTLDSLGALARGLRSFFASPLKPMLHTVMQKYKDKKVFAKAQDCMQAVVSSGCLRVEEIVDELKESLSDKSPAMRLNTLTWMRDRLLPALARPQCQALAVPLLPTLTHLTDDAALETREAAIACMAVAQKTASDPAVDKALAELGQQKLDRLLKGNGRPEPMKLGDTLPAKTEEESMMPFALAEEAKTNPGARPKTGKRQKPATAGEKKPDVEDVGPEPSEEDAMKVLAEVLPPELIAGTARPEWKARLQAFQGLAQWVESQQHLDEKVTEAVGKLVKIRTKDFRESNLGVIKEAIAALMKLAESQTVGKRFASTVVPALTERLGDAKLSEAVCGLMMSISDSASPGHVATLMMKTAAGSPKNINATKGVLTLLGKMVGEFTALLMPVKSLIDFGKASLLHANQQIRQQALGFFSVLFLSIGNLLKHMLGDLKESAMKALEAEFAKLQPQEKGIGDIRRRLRGETEREAAAKKNVRSAADALLPRANIVSQLTSKILNGLMNPAMKQRQEARQALEGILAAANHRIQPIGLGPLFSALRGRMNEPCKNLAKGFIALVGSVAEAAGAGVRQYAKAIVLPLMYNLADKQTSIRGETEIAMEKFATAAGAECIMASAGPLLEKDNPELRTQILGWVLKHKDDLSRAEPRNLVPGVVACLQDRSLDVRTMAEDVVAEMVPLVGHPTFIDAIKDLKPTAKSSVKSVLDRYKIMAPRNEQSMVPQTESAPASMQKPPPLQSYTGNNNPGGNAGNLGVIPEAPASQDGARIGEDPLTEIRPDLLQLMASPAPENTVEAMRAVTERLRSKPGLAVAVSGAVLPWVIARLSGDVVALSSPAAALLTELFRAYEQEKRYLPPSEADNALPIICERLSYHRELLTKFAAVVQRPEAVVHGLFLVGSKSFTHKTRQDCFQGVLGIVGTKSTIADEDVREIGRIAVSSSGADDIKGVCREILIALSKSGAKGNVWTMFDPEISEEVKKIVKKNEDSTGELRRSMKKCSISEAAGINIVTPTKRSLSPLSMRKSGGLGEELKIETLEQCLYQLQFGETSKRIDALVCIGDRATCALEGKDHLFAGHCDRVLGTFADVLRDLFGNGGPVDEIQLRFAKYFLNVMNKVCSARHLVSGAGETELSKIMEQLLSKLLFEGLDKLGTNSEGEMMMKLLNSTTLRLLENCQPTRVFCVLISLLKSTLSSPNTVPQSKLPPLIVKCLLKLTKILEHLLPSLDLPRLFLELHEFLLACPSGPAFKSQNHEMGSRIAKTIVNEVVKFKKEAVWECYKGVEQHPKPDLHIKRWISVILKSLKALSAMSSQKSGVLGNSQHLHQYRRKQGRAERRNEPAGRLGAQERSGLGSG